MSMLSDSSITYNSSQASTITAGRCGLLGLQLLDVTAVLVVAALELRVELRLEGLHWAGLAEGESRELLLQAFLLLHAIQNYRYKATHHHFTTRTRRLGDPRTRTSFSLFSLAKA